MSLYYFLLNSFISIQIEKIVHNVILICCYYPESVSTAQSNFKQFNQKTIELTEDDFKSLNQLKQQIRNLSNLPSLKSSFIRIAFQDEFKNNNFLLNDEELISSYESFYKTQKTFNLLIVRYTKKQLNGLKDYLEQNELNEINLIQNSKKKDLTFNNMDNTQYELVLQSIKEQYQDQYYSEQLMEHYQDVLTYDMPIVDLEVDENNEVGVTVGINIFEYCQQWLKLKLQKEHNESDQ